MTRTLSLSAEVSLPARFESIQETDYLDIFQTKSEHRDTIISMLAHAHALRGRAIELEAVGGLGIAIEDTFQAVAYQVGGTFGVRTGVFGPFTPLPGVQRATYALTAGGGALIHVTDRVAVAAQVHVHYIGRADPEGGDASAMLGLGPWAIRPALGLRVGF